MHFEKLPLALTDEILDRAFNSGFLEEDAGEKVPDSPLLPVDSSPADASEGPSFGCPDYWAGKLAEHGTLFGALALLGLAKDAASGRTAMRNRNGNSARMRLRAFWRNFIAGSSRSGARWGATTRYAI
jgi:hypothetical protein